MKADEKWHSLCIFRILIIYTNIQKALVIIPAAKEKEQ